jgi:hypothetical protein
LQERLQVSHLIFLATWLADSRFAVRSFFKLKNGISTAVALMAAPSPLVQGLANLVFAICLTCVSILVYLLSKS